MPDPCDPDSNPQGKHDDEETDINRVQPGSKVVITVDALGRQLFDGTVEFIHAGIVAPAFQIGEFTKTTRRIPVKINFSKPIESEDIPAGLQLIPEMSAEVKIRTPYSLSDYLPW